MTPSVGLGVSYSDTSHVSLLYPQHGVLTLGDLGGAEAGLDEDVATLGTEGGGDGPGEGLDTGEESGTALNTELELLYSGRELSVCANCHPIS